MPSIMTPDQLKFYQDNGYLVIENFLSQDEVNLLRDDIKTMMKEGKTMMKEGKTMMKEGKTMMKEGNNNGLEEEVVSHMRLMGTKPMLESVNQATFFYEKDSIKDGKLIDPLEKAVHKIAHGVHLTCEGAKAVTHSEKMKEVVKTASGFVNPVIVHGMYILKQPKIGEGIISHRDETYLMTSPPGNVLGIWFAMDDATIENGCLEFVPGSHRNVTPYPLQVRDEELLARHEKDPMLKALKFISGDGGYDRMENEFIHVPTKSGSLVLIHGLVVHRSNNNRATYPRAAYTFHVFEKGNGVKWDQRNWAQETDDYKFVSLY